MKEFMLLFRQPSYDYSDVSKEEMAALAHKWNDWRKGSEKQGKLASRGPRLCMEGKVLKPGEGLADGPFVEIKEKLGSFIVVKAEDLEEATTLAHGCPALDQGGSVEIRPFGNPWSGKKA